MTDNFQSIGSFVSIKDKVIDQYIFLQVFCEFTLTNPGVDEVGDVFLKYIMSDTEGTALGDELKNMSKEEVLRLFAKETLKIIEEPKIKKRLKSKVLQLVDFHPEKEAQEIYDDICRLSFGDAKRLLAVKPLVDEFENSYKAAKPEKKSAKPNLRTLERARIYNHLSPFLKSLRVAPTAKECIAKIKEYPAYRDKKISRQRMETILSEGSSGKYDDIKNIR